MGMDMCKAEVGRLDMDKDDSRSINCSRSGRCSRPFFRLSVTCWRWSSSCCACRALIWGEKSVSQNSLGNQNEILDRETHRWSSVVSGEDEDRKTHGAAVVSKRMCLFFKSWASGRCWRCFSRLSRPSIGETGLSSIVCAVVACAMFVLVMFVCFGIASDLRGCGS